MTTDNTQELDVNKLEQIIADHNKEMRADMASEITGGTRSKSITDVITVKAILDWNNKQIKEALDRLKEPTLEDVRLMQPDTSAEEQRRDVHMKMLRRSTNAKDAGHLTVVLLGFAVDVALEVAKQRELALLERMEDLNFEFMEPCEPDCSDVRHARHEGSWEHYWRMEVAIQKEKEKL